MADVINLLILVSLLILWLVAEFRWGRSSRIGLGLACLVLTLFWLGIVVSSVEKHLGMQRFNLVRMAQMLDDQEEEDVRQALRLYEDTYQQTGSSRAAIHRMYSFLIEARYKPDQ